jgi:aspartate racemase
MGSGPRIVGVIGGMGPEATIELMRRVIAMTPARDDQDHVHLIVDNNPQVPSRIAHLIEGAGPDPTPVLQRMARGLRAAGAQALAMPCNTAHGYADAIRAVVDVPLLDMVELTVTRIVERMPGARAGLLASSAVIRTQLYARALRERQVTLQTPARQNEVMDLIKAVKRGETGSPVRGPLADIARELTASCDVIIVACSELSLLADSIDAAVPVIDSLDILSEAIVSFATPTRKP